MEHHSSLPAPQPWRSAALIAAAVASAELCLLVVLGVIVFGKFFSGQVERATDPAAVAEAAVAEKSAGAQGTEDEAGKPAAKPMLTRRETSIIVLNGNGVSGAAAVMAERVRGRHYRIAATDNAPRLLARSLVMYRPGFEREAKRLGGDIGIKRLSPLDGVRPRALQGAHVAVLIGTR